MCTYKEEQTLYIKECCERARQFVRKYAKQHEANRQPPGEVEAMLLTLHCIDDVERELLEELTNR